MFIKLDDALNWLYTRKRFDRRTDLSIIEDALKLLGNPEKSFKAIHIAGTNGKGSTSKYLYNILKNNNYKVGLFTSPHVLKFNERIIFDGEMINDDDLLELINYIYDFNEAFMKSHETLTFFELTTIMAFLYYSRKKADIAVIECGLGGRLDATNVIKPLVSIITSISKDHMEVLGNSYKKILKEKLGIVKIGVPLVTPVDREELMDIIKDYTYNHNSELHLVRNVRSIKLKDNGTSFTYKGESYDLSLIGMYQPYNAASAIETINILNEKYDFNISTDSVKKALKETVIPGRFEVLEGGNIILDGGHNEDALNKCLQTLSRYSHKNIISIFGCMKDKDYHTMVKILDKFTTLQIFTKVNYPRALDPKELLSISLNNNKFTCENIEEAIKFAKKKRTKNDIIIIHGSLYLVSEARELLVR